MFVTADQILAHAVGDYIIQSDWMADNKTRRSLAAGVHAITYTLPFLFLTQDWRALAIIAGTHFLIDRFRLARWVVWAKNGYLFTRGLAITNTGYGSDKPPFLAVWLLIIADNILHVICNATALMLFA